MNQWRKCMNMCCSCWNSSGLPFPLPKKAWQCCLPLRCRWDAGLAGGARGTGDPGIRSRLWQLLEFWRWIDVGLEKYQDISSWKHVFTCKITSYTPKHILSTILCSIFLVSKVCWRAQLGFGLTLVSRCSTANITSKHSWFCLVPKWAGAKTYRDNGWWLLAFLGTEASCFGVQSFWDMGS